MSTKSVLLKGTFILTFVGFLTRIMGFFYRIMMSRIFTAEEIGIYQLIFPIYALGISLSCAGIQTALSKCTATYYAGKQKDKALQTLKIALSFSILLSVFLIIFVQTNASYIAASILGEPKCESLLVIMTYAFPFASFHSCICGFYLGQKNCEPIAVSQFMEQLLRISAVFVLIIFCMKHRFSVSISTAVWGLVIGELSACIYILLFYGKKLLSSHFTLKEYILPTGQFFRYAVPLTANRVCINVMQSMESISIPLKLQAYGIDSASALSIYGIFSGMALPCILFPSAITNALSSMLLPTVAEFQVSKEKTVLKKYLHKIIVGCLLMGSCCLVIFFASASFIGNFIFKTPLAGEYIQALAFLCPFLYTNTTLLTTLNGLGKTTTTFVINIISLLIRIISVHFFIPVLGLRAYFYGLLCSQLFISCSSYYKLNHMLS